MRLSLPELEHPAAGGFHLALQAQVPIVPATVSGTLRITPRESLRVESGPVLIRYGKPIPTEGMTVEDRNRLKDLVRAAIESELEQPREDEPAHAA